MEHEDFLFEQQDYSYGGDYYPPPRWWDLRARWGLMSGAHRTNAVLYALGAVSLALLMFEVTSGENNPDLQVAGQVLPVASSTTSTSRPAARVTTTSSRPSSTTSSTVASTSRTTVATTGTTRRPAAPTGGGQAAPVETDDPDPPAADPVTPTPTNPPQQTTTPTSPATTAAPTTQPTSTSPPVTLSERACELLAQAGRTFPGCP